MSRANKLIGLLVAGAWAAQAALAGSAPKETPELLKKGKEVYTTNCLTCHGEKGDGSGPAGLYMNPKPRDFAAPAKFKKGGGPDELFKTITEGLPETAMVGFPAISEADRWALVHYVRSLYKAGAKKGKGK